MIAIISDIHGNYPALESVLADIRKKDVDQVVFLGDAAGYYPFINECIDALQRCNSINLMGNHDYYIVSKLKCNRSKSVNDLAVLQNKKITDNNLQWLSCNRICYVKDNFSMVHGGWENPIDEYIREVSDNYFSRFPQKFFFSGHTHVQCIIKLRNGQVYCNPGSVGQPRDGNPMAAFALFNGKNIELCRVRYDIDRVADSLKQHGFSDYYYDNLYHGSRIGGKIDRIEYLRKKIK